MENGYRDILEYVFESGQIVTGDDTGAVDADEVEACVRYEAEERGVDADAAVAFAMKHTIRKP